MSAPAAVAATFTWPEDVLAFAETKQVRDYLEPLLAATRRSHPTAREIKVLLEEDAEVRDDRYIVFEVFVPASDVPDYFEAKRPWHAELFRLCQPRTKAALFRQTLFLLPA
jgi:hypothetical protein